MKREEEEQVFVPEEFMDSILKAAILERASDVHIEPLADGMRVRIRVDGYLREKVIRPITDLEPTLTRIKAISGLDITSHNPQDGRFEFTASIETPGAASGGGMSIGNTPFASPPSALERLLGTGTGQNSATNNQPTTSLPPGGPVSTTHLLNIRVSFFPTVYGEAAVLRLLNRSEMLMTLEDLGMEEDVLMRVKGLISKSYGMVLVTGPAGSGKTTMLYSILQKLKGPQRNIVTLEDPVEFYFGDIRQSQIRPQHGLTFAEGMRSILRQDPDIIMIGEIRDPETAEYATRASLVGRLVFSTVHSNTTIGTIARLLDMNIERSLIAYAINGIIAQRLLRKICNSCKVADTPSLEHLRYLNWDGVGTAFMKGAGCNECSNTGYQGRTGIFTALMFDDNLRALIVDKASMGDLQRYEEQLGVKSLRDQAIQKVMQGVITLEEAVRAI